MAEVSLDSGHLAPGEEDLLDFGLIAEEEIGHGGNNGLDEQNLVLNPDVDADEFDFQLGGIDTAEDMAEDTGHSDIHLAPSSRGDEASRKYRAESEIGYEDEDAGLDASHQAASHQAAPLQTDDIQVADDADNYEEITYEDEGNVALEDSSLADVPPVESTSLDQPADQDHHNQALDEEELEDLGFDPELAASAASADTAQTAQEAHEKPPAQNREALLPEQVEAEAAQDLEQSLSPTKDGHEENVDGEGPGEGQPSQHRSDIMRPPDIPILYNNTSYELCAKEDNDNPDTYFFAGDLELDYPLSDFLSCLREVISNEVSPKDEIIVRVDQLGLEFGEVRRTNSIHSGPSDIWQHSNENFLHTTTFRDILWLYERLQGNDGVTEYSAPVVELLTRPDCTQRYSKLLDAADQGIGLAELLDYLDQSQLSNATSPAKDDADYGDHYEEDGELGSHEEEAKDIAEENFLGSETAHVEDGFPEDTLVADAGMVGSATADEEAAEDAAIMADSVPRNFQQEIYSEYSGDDVEGEGEIDFNLLEDQEEMNHDTAHLDYTAALGQQDTMGKENDFPSPDVLAADEQQQYGGADVRDNSGHAPDEAAIGNVNVLEAGAEEVDQAEEESKMDGFGDGIGGGISDGDEAAQAEVAAASVATDGSPILPPPLPQSNSPGIARGFDSDPVKDLMEIGNMWVSLPRGFGKLAPMPATASESYLREPLATEVDRSPQKSHEAMALTKHSTPQAGLDVAWSGSQDAHRPPLGAAHGIASPHSHHGSGTFSGSAFAPTLDANSPHFKDYSDSGTKPRSGPNVTHESMRETEFEQNEYEDGGQSENFGTVEDNKQHDGATHTGVDVGESRNKVSQDHPSSPASTIKGVEISYDVAEDDAGDTFDLDLREPQSSSEAIGQNLDEIDWENDGDDDIKEGVEGQDPATLTSPSRSVKRSRQLDDSGSLADESDVKRRRT
ncbi:hypothetical protein QBC33DRAFT_342519 [Phialemonium atrogriseum]|uniref:Uncharacterized protein n=1 Tax=Phialemonium atrogriseum TaxID=1093897 RepID=A0AAJ0FNB0_9PEZI|nr:uncharacterized protein QBC33DRAFT_342519 [Phialemonium atrogriseum]KAK1769108.1 hypothetical protein QBC33DRAFT_342519 [Phialemonium atrogriseum]